MKLGEFIHLVQEPHTISSADAERLSELAQAFPFFQTAQMLYALGLKENAPQHYQKQLRKTAIVVNNRAVLYELLHRPKPAIIIAEPELPVVTEPVTEPKKEEVSVPVQTSSSHITADDVKVVYITTTPAKDQVQEPLKEPPVQHDDSVKEELDLLKAIENDTVSPTVEAPAFDEAKLNREIEMEVSKQLIDSYVQKEIIRTPELHDISVKTEDRPVEEPEIQAEPGSFMHWLQQMKEQKSSVQSAKETAPETPEIDPQKPENTAFEEKRKLIDRIIESDPGKIRMNKEKFYNASQDAKQSLLENEHLITETLAKIYALQGNISKAIRAYEVLSLKFPSKRAYFESLIEKLKSR